MNEKYGIELELVTNKFKEKIEQVKKAFRGIGNEKIDMSKQVKIDNLKREFELASNQAEMLRHKLKTLKNELSQKQQWEIGTKSYVKLQNEIDKTSIQLEKAGVKVDNLNNKLNALETTNITSSITKGTSNLTKGLDKMTSKIKRFGLSLLSIRSIWALVSRASSAYLAQDTALADKLQAVWAGLGAMLAPIIEKIVNILSKGVAYINIFIKALTGVDLLARASAKSMNKAAKSAKGLNKSLAGFDELNNLDTDAGAGTGISNPFASIKNEELPWADKVQAFGEWVKNNMPLVTGLLAGLGIAILATKTGLVGVLAEFFNTSKIAVIAGVILIITGIIKGIQDVIKLIKNPSWEQFGKVIQDIGLILLGFGLIIGNIPLIVAGGVALIVGLVVEYWDKIKEILGKVGKWIYDNVLIPVCSFIKGTAETILNIITLVTTTIGGIFTALIGIVLAPFEALGKTVKDVFNGIVTIIKGIGQVFKGIFTGDMKTVLNGFKTIFKGVFNSLWGIAKYPLNLIISGINALIRGANKIRIDVPSWVPGLGGKQFGFNIKQIPMLNVGTNYVPEDQLAYIHKGEAVVPKKFNSQEYFGRGNDETNSLLEQVIEAINNIEVNPYTTIRDVGKTAVNYINGKKRQYGRSVI